MNNEEKELSEEERRLYISGIMFLLSCIPVLFASIIFFSLERYLLFSACIINILLFLVVGIYLIKNNKEK